eukprot:CAMPEP_0202491464 /NCGR_PEP_ID=MMETSP1361-20130828/8523_1 /ASSEMBLY_ACC=CAM_ASM_000849 /TAXON_ID=210615 /ORGANISM="Staurosira complex sp., Strain CCMP2646" /LENGTH=102 /DNA_ID=CAMNT_0049121517 /DNA_START=545 /DNA_END=853 /DNA_ORIENTATION=-
MPRKLFVLQVKVSCVFRAHGCTDKIKRTDVDQHMQDFHDEHLELLAGSAAQTKLENKLLCAKVKRLEKEINHMKQNAAPKPFEPTLLTDAAWDLFSASDDEE